MNGSGDGEERIIVIRKREKGGHDEHHGGSWKVAYADFVTAMMAFFLVMWIMGMDEGVRDMVQGYFSNPMGFERRFSGGTNPLAAGNAPVNFEEWRNVLLKRRAEYRRFQTMAHRLQEEIEESGVMRGVPAEVEIVVTREGLRVELMETGEEEIFFDRASDELKPALRSVLAVLASSLGEMNDRMVLEGHTDSLSFRGDRYTNWELSVARANAARRVLVSAGLEEGRIVQVRGYAAEELKVPDDPASGRNRRITILLPFEEELPTMLPLGDSGIAGADAGRDGPPPLLLPSGEEP